MVLVVMGGALLTIACGSAPNIYEPVPAGPAPLATVERVETRRGPPLQVSPDGGGFHAYRGAQLTPGSLFEGHYLCAQGDTGMALRVDEVRGRRVGGVFSFFHEPTKARGSFVIEGELAPNGEIVFHPRQWVEHPPNYVAVPFRLQVSDDGLGLRGGVMDESCGVMEAQRVASP